MGVWPRVRNTGLTRVQVAALPLKLLLFLIFDGDKKMDDRKLQNLRQSVTESVNKIIDDALHDRVSRDESKQRLEAIQELLSEAEFENALEKISNEY